MGKKINAQRGGGLGLERKVDDDERKMSVNVFG